MLIQVMNGPNLNLLGTREPGVYGSQTLDDVIKGLQGLAKDLGADVVAYQSNHEGDLVTKIQQCKDSGVSGILINPGAYGHTSIAIRDALAAVALPFVEVHVSNIHAREEFRRHSMISDLAAGVVVGFGPDSYALGLRGLIAKIAK